MDEHSEATLRRHYARTTLPSMGIDFERGMQHAMVRIVVEGAAAAEKRRRDIESTRTAG